MCSRSNFPNTILFVADVEPGTVVHWKKLFLADLKPAANRRAGAQEASESPLVTVARDAVAIPDTGHNRIQLSMTDASSHQVGSTPEEYINSSFPRGQQVLEAAAAGGAPRPPLPRNRHVAAGPIGPGIRGRAH